MIDYEYRNKQRPLKWDEAEAVYSEFAIARGSATITISRDSKAGGAVGKLHSEDLRKC